MVFIRGTALQGFVELSRELGWNPSDLLREAHIPIDSVGNQDAFINLRGAVAVLENAAAQTGVWDFGRQLARRQGIDILGPVGVAARTAPTAGAAMQAIEQYMSVYSPGLLTTVQAEPGERLARLDWRLSLDRAPPHAQSAELGLGVAVRVLALLAGEDFSPVVVNFRHQALSSSEDYARYFGCPVRFEQTSTELVFSRSFLSRPLGADSGVHDVVREYLASIAVPVDVHATEPVRLLIRRMLPTGGLTLELVAAHLALHPRTLQRQLTAQGTSFAGLVDEVRREEAERYLRETDVPLGQLAGILGYSEQSVLSRSCQRWFGTSASAVRSRSNDAR